MPLRHPPEYYCAKYKHSFMEMAIAVAKNSVAERKKVGCVLYLNNDTVSYGWNGMYPGCQSEQCEINNVTREDCRHAEQNAIYKVVESEQQHLLLGAICFVTMQPCKPCSDLLVRYGIKKVYYLEDYRLKDGLDNLLDNGIIVERVEI